MKRLTPIKTILVVILAVVITFLAIGWQRARAREAAFTETDGRGGDVVNCEFFKCVAFDNPLDGVSDLLGMTDAEFDRRHFQNRESLVDLAEEANVDIQEVIDIAVENEIEWTNQLVADGHYTPREGKKALGDVVDSVTLHVISPYKDPFLLSSEIIGVDYFEFLQAMESGQTPAEVARQNGVHPEVIYEVLLESEMKHIDAKVKYGVESETLAELTRIHTPQFARDVVYKEGFYDRFFSLSKLPILNLRDQSETDYSIEDLIEDESNSPPITLHTDTVIIFSAKAIGIDKDDLQQQLKSGRKIAEVAREHDVAPEVIIDELALVQAEIVEMLIKLGTFSKNDGDSFLLDQNYLLSEIVYKANFSQ